MGIKKYMFPQKYNLICLLLILCLEFTVALPVKAGDITVSLKADRAEAGLDDFIRLVVSVSGSRSTGVYPSIQGLDSFQVSRSGTSSRMQIINGKVDASVDYTYFLQPRKTGTFAIGPAEVKVKGKSYQSNTLTLKVKKAEEVSGGDRGLLFLMASLSRERLFLEEQAIYTLKLYHRINVRNPSLSLPETENLSFTQLGDPREYQSVLQGQTYQVLEVQYVVIASKEGDYRLSPARMNLTVLEQRRRSSGRFLDDSFFDDPFFSSGRPGSVASDAIELQVLPLPKQGRPADFSGLVGVFQLESSLEPVKVKAGESTTLTVKLKGRGNIKRMPDLKLPAIQETKIYADQPVLEEGTDDQGMSGVKTMKWAIVPEKEGEYNIPALTVSYFDTRGKRYQTINTDVHSLSVLPGEKEGVKFTRPPAAGRETEASTKREVKEVGHDILPIHSAMSNLGRGRTIAANPFLIWMILIIPAVIYGATFFGLKARRRAAGNTAAVKSKKAWRQFSRRCGRGGIGATELIDAVREYLNDRLHLSQGLLTSGEAYEILASHGVNRETAGQVREMIRDLEDAVYTGKGRDECRIVEDIKQVIRKLDREIR